MWATVYENKKKYANVYTYTRTRARTRTYETCVLGNCSPFAGSCHNNRMHFPFVQFPAVITRGPLYRVPYPHHGAQAPPTTADKLPPTTAFKLSPPRRTSSPHHGGQTLPTTTDKLPTTAASELPPPFGIARQAPRGTTSEQKLLLHTFSSNLPTWSTS